VPRPTDGAAEALLLQNGPSVTRLSQDVAVPTDRPELTFDVGYRNWDTEFSEAQALQVQIRDVDSDVLLASAFQASGALEAPMVNHVFDLAEFAGMDVRVQFEVVAQNTFFDVQLDHVDVRPRSAGPATVDPTLTADDLEVTDDQAGGETAVVDVGGCSTGKGGGSLLAALALVALRRRRRR
jgi:uncharacterized protein (TIGR03382 family)